MRVVGCSGSERCPSDPGAATDAEQASECDEALMHQRRLRHLRDQVSNLVDAIAHGALRSSAVIANRLLELEARLAEEEARAPRGDQPPQHGVTQSVQFYEQFFATISEQFRESACETRSALGKLVGGAVRLMPKEEAQQLEVTCALCTTALSLNELIRA